jgi:hypothetical protein
VADQATMDSTAGEFVVDATPHHLGCANDR